MPMKCRRGIVVAGATFAWVALAFCLGERGAARPAAAPETPSKDKLTLRYYGAKEGCAGAGCHTTPPNPTDFFLVRCTEYEKWVKEDKHAEAYRKLSEPHGRQMATLLGYKRGAAKEEECLSCHGAVIKDDKLKDGSFKPDEGVNCALCHGPYKDWIAKHGVFAEREEWRKLSRQEKQERFGLTDLWTPVKRAGLCASCHVGALEPGKPAKFVTHRMYAAGHPPLPGFEAATFSDQMPRHWDYLREKRKNLLEKYHYSTAQVKELIGYDGVDEERTKLILVSAAVSLRDSMRLLGRQAAECAKADDADKQSLDLANFDCYACHHDLKSPSWRQARGYAGKPGRVPMRPWPSALVRLAVRHAADDDAGAKTMDVEFNAKWGRLQAAFEARPFGDVARIAPAADELARWADDLARRLDKKACDEAAARKLLAQLPALFEGTTPDYDSARQIAWAFEAMHSELYVRPGKADPRVKQVLESLKKDLKLDLPSGQKHNLIEELEDGLKRLNSYNPDSFRKALGTLSALTAEK